MIDRTDTARQVKPVYVQAPKPAEGRSTVNAKLKAIWQKHDERETITLEELQYIRDYYNTQAAYWNNCGKNKLDNMGF